MPLTPACGGIFNLILSPEGVNHMVHPRGEEMRAPRVAYPPEAPACQSLADRDLPMAEMRPVELDLPGVA